MNGETKFSDYEVGFGKPPTGTRFKKGQSGNPKGRPKGALNWATILARSLREKVIINENGHRKVITKLEAAVKQLVNMAAGGDLRALRHLADLVARAGRGVRHLGSAQYEFVRSAINQIDQAGVARRRLNRQSDDLAQHLVQGKARTDNTADPVEDR